MTKIVINKCYGSFGLSHTGYMTYADEKGITLYPELTGRYYVSYTYYLSPESDPDRKMLDSSDIPRDDPALVKTVEILGEESCTDSSYLSIVEIPDDVDWVIGNDDGNEEIHEVHRTWN